MTLEVVRPSLGTTLLHRTSSANWRDEALLDALQASAFAYFVDNLNPGNGLIRDSTRTDSPCSIAAVGFALSCYPVAVDRGWISRAQAAELTLTTLRFFHTSHQGPEPDATGHQGFYYHFLDMENGRRTWSSELSLIDSSLLIAGALTAASYFSEQRVAEDEIRQLADRMYRRMDWHWSQGKGESVSHGWVPEGGFFRYEWEGYSEAAVLYVLALASPTHPISYRSYRAWKRTYQWEEVYGVRYLYAGPLFIHLFSHAWIDFRGIQDQLMAFWKTDYFKNTQQAIRVQREFARLNPNGFVGYGPDLWGLTACNGPTDTFENIDGDAQSGLGYAARGVPFGPDDGTIAPWAPLACLPFDEDAGMSAVQHMLASYPNLLRDGQFPDSFNPTAPGDDPEGWLAPNCSGLDQGLVVMMIENHRSGLPWRLTRKCAPIRLGLERAKFRNGWLT